MTAVADLTDAAYASIENEMTTTGVLLDFRKAFDSIDHDIICKKFKFLGFSELTIRWFKSYLTDRMQRIKVNNMFSSYEKIKRGVPQGSILGPTIFLLFINDLSNILEGTEVSSYADDTLIYCSGKNTQDQEGILNRNLKRVFQWCLSLIHI